MSDARESELFGCRVQSAQLGGNLHLTYYYYYKYIISFWLEYVIYMVVYCGCFSVRAAGYSISTK